MTLNEKVKNLFPAQKEQWELAKQNIQNLAKAEQKTFRYANGVEVLVQHNPARITSSGAKVDAQSIAERPCFLCAKNRPAEQMDVPFRSFDIAVNPFPILPYHLTIIEKSHTVQRILPHLEDFFDLASELTDFTVFYNGAQCGASAPDHMHFQAVKKGLLPLEREFDAQMVRGTEKFTQEGGRYVVFDDYLRTCVGMEEMNVAKLAHTFRSLMQLWQETGSSDEPKVNVFCWKKEETYACCIFLRERHRPSYFCQGEQSFVISPGAIDMAGIVITPRTEDYERLTPELVQEIYRQVSRSSAEPEVSVGVMNALQVAFVLNGKFVTSAGKSYEGEYTAQIEGDKIKLADEEFSSIEFIPLDEKSWFELKEVTIGINFHWQRKENQQFGGKLKLIEENGAVTAINRLMVEDYLKCVISSEMSSLADRELLKAHAVISRSWLLANMHTNNNIVRNGKETADEIIRWYERDAHQHYDVCADDHCQRYQGKGRIQSAEAIEAVAETRGEVLMNGGEICDARFSKSCGGMSELFENCWAPTPMEYLQKVYDAEAKDVQSVDLTQEKEAERWILSSPVAYCNTTDARILRKVLNNYDQETTDFYRWKVVYDVSTLSALVKKRSGIDFGEIQDLVPVERGTSGRLVKLKIVGSKRTLVVGKELEIRKWLSESHLYSSAFVVKKERGVFTLYGAGWGHGVGLCQIGAALMSEKGYSYEQILLHYYRGNTKIVRLF